MCDTVENKAVLPHLVYSGKARRYILHFQNTPLGYHWIVTKNKETIRNNK